MTEGMRGSSRADLVVEDKVVVETQCLLLVKLTHEEHTLSYRRIAKIPVGLILNFGPKPAVHRYAPKNDRRVRSVRSSSALLRSSSFTGRSHVAIRSPQCAIRSARKALSTGWVSEITQEAVRRDAHPAAAHHGHPFRAVVDADRPFPAVVRRFEARKILRVAAPAHYRATVRRPHAASRARLPWRRARHLQWPGWLHPCAQAAGAAARAADCRAAE